MPRRPPTWRAGRCLGEWPSLYETVKHSGATALLGLSGVPDLFNQPIVEALHANAARPIVFPLSNPTANVEAQPADVLRWTNGAAIVASGSPFADVELEGKSYPIGQGNNAFIFPGLGFGAIISRAREITDSMIMAAAETLADETAQHGGLVYPPISCIRDVSLKVAVRVARQAIFEGVAAEKRVRNLTDDELAAFVQRRFWQPHYLPLRKAEDAQMLL